MRKDRAFRQRQTGQGMMCAVRNVTDSGTIYGRIEEK